MHENTSIEIQAWPLTHPLSFLIDLSYAYASSKNGIGKLGECLGHPQIPSLVSDREDGLLPSSATLRKQDVLPLSVQSHRDTLFSCHTSQDWDSHRVCVCVCLLSWFKQTSSTYRIRPRVFCIFIIYLSSIYIFITYTHCYTGLLL